MRFLYCIAAAALFAAALTVAGPAFADDASVTGALVQKLHDKGVLNDADYDELMRPASPADDQALNRRLIRKLYEKGILDEASFAELSQMAGMAFSDVHAPAGAQPAAAAAEAHAEPQASPAKEGEMTAREAVKPVDKALTAVEQGVAKIGGDKVSLRLNFFFQGGFINDSSGYSVGTPPTSDMSTTSGSQFFVRRARIYLGGNVLEKLGYKVSFETATTSAILRDAYVYLDYIPYARVTVGQFKVPYGMEGPLALADLPVANRSLATNFIHAAKLRDRGAMLSGKVDYGTSDNPLSASYGFGVFNGSGYNKTDDNNTKDVGLRVRFNPMLSCLTIGGSVYTGKTRQKGGIDKDWNRWGAELEWNPKYLKGMKVMGEFLWTRQYFDTYVTRNIIDTTNTKDDPLPTFGRYTHGYGWYLLAAYRVNGFSGGWGFMNGFEPAVRYDMLDEDMAISDDERTRTTLGLNYYLAKGTRLMLNYELIHADGKLRYKSLELIDNVGHRLLTTLVQVKF